MQVKPASQAPFRHAQPAQPSGTLHCGNPSVLPEQEPDIESNVEQGTPPPLFIVLIVRVRECEPDVQLEHGVQVDQSLRTQSTDGSTHAGWPVHFSGISTNSGHAIPPCAGWTTTVLRRYCIPLGPQDGVHGSYSDHSVTSQSFFNGSYKVYYYLQLAWQQKILSFFTMQFFLTTKC